MKISSGSHNLYRCYNEARGIAQNKNSVLRRKSPNAVSFLQTSIINSCLLLIIVLCIVSYCKLSYLYLFISLAPLVFDHIYVFFYLRRLRNNSKKFYNEFDEEGLHDESFYGIKMLFTWRKIQAIVIGKYSVVILTDTPCYFYYNIDKKDEILEAVERYSRKKRVIGA